MGCILCFLCESLFKKFVMAFKSHNEMWTMLNFDPCQSLVRISLGSIDCF